MQQPAQGLHKRLLPRLHESVAAVEVREIRRVHYSFDDFFALQLFDHKVLERELLHYAVGAVCVSQLEVEERAQIIFE